MSNHKKERHKRVVFAEDHVRISPEGLKELYALENRELYGLVLQVYNNTPLFSQFSKNWQHRIRLVRRYNENSYIEDIVLSYWVEFFRRVLMPMEDQWQADRLKLYGTRSESEVHYMSLLVTHPALKEYISKETANGRSFDAVFASVDEAREALRWCNLYERIRKNRYFAVYFAEHPNTFLNRCTYLQLKEIAGNLTSFERRASLIRQIQTFEGANHFLVHKYPGVHQTENGLLGYTESKLRAILDELRSMHRSGVQYDESGELVAKSTNSD